MYYTVDVPTRVTETPQSAIDNFITNFERDKINVSCLNTELSDHDGQLFCIKMKKAKR